MRGPYSKPYCELMGESLTSVRVKNGLVGVQPITQFSSNKKSAVGLACLNQVRPSILHIVETFYELFLG